jgi:hypothetical protein
MLLSKSAATVSLSDFGDKKNLLSIPEFSLEDYQRPENNLLFLSARQQIDDDFDKALLTAMFFGKATIDSIRGDETFVVRCDRRDR